MASMLSLSKRIRTALGVVMAAAGIVGSVGCGTLAGQHETITFESEPAGADVVVQCGKVHLTAVTPGAVRLSRKAPDCFVTFSKAGFRDQGMTLESGISRPFWLNMIGAPGIAVGAMATYFNDDAPGDNAAKVAGAACLLPLAVDLAAGNFRDHDPKQVHVFLEPVPTAVGSGPR